MAIIYISVGSNINAEYHVCAGIKALRELYGDITTSIVYESDAVGFEGDNFYNLVVKVTVDDDVETVVINLRIIEDNFNRDRSGPKFSSRTLDLDLLLYDDLILNKPHLELPRGEITKNAFVLLPLSELAAELLHPIEKKSIGQLWREYDKASQKLWPIEISC
ncbi:2-amino-4-hydroxy-6-hydroxymethyldihydropteridinepyrophosphokinase [hydrothermal vent metagenome]|uniref:2-amino-4-hydroxy-6-hydroxymethyldihydropteridine diphosphokinase n=1 Tax=hydrothermal vent metagenome TaxID=652676 RepID=A0A3B1A1S4_9ZZZZ